MTRLKPDPIVEEARKAGAALMEKAGDDPRVYFRRLAECQKRYVGQLVTKRLRLPAATRRA